MQLIPLHQFNKESFPFQGYIQFPDQKTKFQVDPIAWKEWMAVWTSTGFELIHWPDL